MDLKSGCLYWPQVSRTDLRCNPLEADAKCDVAIIGAGVTGALAGFYLSQAGVDVAIVDRRQPSHGSTAASTGLLQYEIDTLLSELIQRLGEECAQRAYRASVQALDAFGELAWQLDDDCDYIPRPSLYLATQAQDAELFRREYEARRKIGIEVELLGESEIRRRFGFDRPRALWSHRAAEIDPYRLAQALHRASIRNGARIFGDTEITKYQSDDNGVMLSDASGHQIRARHVIFATGYETPEFVDRDICTLKSTYALASEPVRPELLWEQRCLIWEHRDPYFYARTAHDERIMIGGADIDSADPTVRDSLLAKKSVELIDSFKRLFPQIPMESNCCWAGTFAQTKDGLPYIGSLKKFPHGYFALGYGGNGITFGLLAARIIRDLILGKPSPDADLFRFDR